MVYLAWVVVGPVVRCRAAVDSFPLEPVLPPSFVSSVPFDALQIHCLVPFPAVVSATGPCHVGPSHQSSCWLH